MKRGIVGAILIVTCASAQTQQPPKANAQQAEEQPLGCYQFVMTVNNVVAPLGSILIDKCTGQTWELRRASVTDDVADRWFPKSVETQEFRSTK
jgi:hypothetical protein